MSAMNLFSLPPEIRRIIWKYAIGDIGNSTVIAQPRSSKLESRGLDAGTERQLRMFPNPSNSALPIYLKELSREGFTVPRPDSLLKDYDKVRDRLFVTGGPQPGSCRDCGKLQDREGLAELCWECADSGISLLYTCRNIFNEAVAVLYESTLPVVENTESLIHFMYCVNSHGHGGLVKRIMLQGIIAPDRLHHRGALLPPGVFPQALPNLKKVCVDMAEEGRSYYRDSSPRSEQYTPWSTASDLVSSVFWSQDLRPVVAVLVQTFAEFDGLEAEVTGLNCPEVHLAIEKSIAGKLLIEHDFESATDRAVGGVESVGGQ